MTKWSSGPANFRASSVIASRKFSGAWIFQVQELPAEPSVNSGVDMTPGTLASMSMSVLEGEQTKKSKYIRDRMNTLNFKERLG